MNSPLQYKESNDFDLDFKINEVVILTQKFIKELKKELGEEDYKKVAKVIINEHLENI